MKRLQAFAAALLLFGLSSCDTPHEEVADAACYASQPATSLFDRQQLARQIERSGSDGPYYPNPFGSEPCQVIDL